MASRRLRLILAHSQFQYPSHNFINIQINMKYLATLLFISQAAAFTVAPSHIGAQTRLYAEDYKPMEGEGKINLKIDLDSPKVASTVEMEKGKKTYCRCWLSGTFPMCDGTHMKHNEATGDNVGPLIVAVKKE